MYSSSLSLIIFTTNCVPRPALFPHLPHLTTPLQLLDRRIPATGGQTESIGEFGTGVFLARLHEAEDCGEDGVKGGEIVGRGGFGSL
jgi:hypothetical protein